MESPDSLRGRRSTKPSRSPQAKHTMPKTANLPISAGTYLGNIHSDSKGSSQSDVFVTVTRIDRTKVRVASDNQRIGTFEVDLTRIGENLFNVGGESSLIAYTQKNAPELTLTARGEVSYGGTK